MPSTTTNGKRTARPLLTALAGVALGLFGWWVFRGDEGPPRSARRAPPSQADTPGPAVARQPGASPRPAAPPNFTPVPAAPGRRLQNDPTQPDYDATQIIRTTGASIKTVFDAETRDPTWAPQREQAVAELVKRDLGLVKLDASVEKVECHQATCQLTLKGASQEELGKASILMQYVPVATVYEPGPIWEQGGTWWRTALIGYSPQVRDAERWQQHYKEKRPRQLAQWRRDGVPPHYPPIPPE